MKGNSALVLLFASIPFLSSCSYDPEPIGCSFRVEATGGLRIGGVSMAPYSEEGSLPSDSVLSIITDSLDSGHCPLEFGVSVMARNDNTRGEVIIDDFDWTCQVSIAGNIEEIDSGELSGYIKINPGDPRNILCIISINAAQVLYGDYSQDQIMSLCYALGGENRALRDADHLGRVSIQGFVTEETPHGLIDNRGPFLVNLNWIQP